MQSIHRNSYKYWQRRPKSISIKLIKLRCLIKEVHAANNGSAGAKNIAGIVTTQSIALSRYRTSKLIKGLNLELPITETSIPSSKTRIYCGS